ncbi:PAAR domain-containing protein [Marinobacter bryozoorum]|uniref:PAAR domain-containing protein n=1 Tax=Marinobacter bryozoorum TaxID=256324 RepID=UPI002002F4F2|nr:PAAR domain-containing protein [Marinobacter bryozoorum]MCK7545668.1 PAAR domain-containing protein [Marinobacter bryozoorum]
MGKPAATLSCYHTCPDKTGNKDHIGGPIVAGSSNVVIGGMPAARVGDKVVCRGPGDTIAKGSSSVFVNGQAVARVGDETEHGGTIVAGNPTVIVG